MKSCYRILDIKLILPTEVSKRRAKLQGKYKDWKQIKNFIEKRLEKRLKKDQEKLKILTEGDLQSCVYHHLRGYIKDASNWYILNNLSMGKKGKNKKIPDIVILYWRSKEEPEPVFLIELKETIGPLSDKSMCGYKRDIKKLNSLSKKKRKKRKVRGAYLIISVLPDYEKKKLKISSTREITEAIQNIKSSSNIYEMVINTQYVKKKKNIYIDPGFRDKQIPLRKYRG